MTSRVPNRHTLSRIADRDLSLLEILKKSSFVSFVVISFSFLR